MPVFRDALSKWPSEAFPEALKLELEKLDSDALSLRQATSLGGPVDDSSIKVMVLSAGDSGDAIRAEAGVFFDEILGGCSCGDEPAPLNSYCRLRIRIDKASAEAGITVIPE